MIKHCRELPQVEVAYTGEEAAALLEMPVDREGDLVVIAKKNAAIGGRADEHDLALMKDPSLTLAWRLVRAGNSSVKVVAA